MEESERRVLANMVVYPERAFDLVGRLGIRAEDFSVPASRAAFAALVRKGVAPSEKLMLEVAKCSGEKQWTNAEIDAFRDLAPSLAEVDHECVSFAQGVARVKLQKDSLALMSDPTLPADMLPGELDKAKAEYEARLGDIDRVRGSFAPGPNGVFDDTLPTPEELLDMPGFVNALADYTCRTAQRPNRVTAFAGALAMLSYLAGRKFTDARSTMPNLYLVALAGSGGGKNPPRAVNKKLGMALDSFGVQDKFASGPGLEDALLACPTRLFQRDEFDTLLNELKDKTSLSEGIMEDILNLFSESHTCHAMRKKALTDREREALASGNRPSAGERMIYYPSLTLFGTAVPGNFYGALTLRALTNGLLARTLVFEAGRHGRRGRGPFDLPFPDEVLQTAQMLYSREREPDWLKKPHLQVVPDADDVAEEMERLYEEEERLLTACENAKDEAGLAVWARAIEITGKLTLLYAISENPVMPKITARGVRWAWKLVQHSSRRMLAMVDAYVADDAEDADAQKVRLAIGEYGRKGVARSVVARKLHLSKKRMDAAEATLLDRGEIELKPGKGGATIYRLKKGDVK